MSQKLSFEIDIAESNRTETLALKSLNPLPLKSQQSSSEKEAIEFLCRQELRFQTKNGNKKSLQADRSFSTFHIESAQVIETLKLIAAVGQLYCNDKLLVSDFYSKSDFYYFIEKTSDNQIIISGKIKGLRQEFDLSECDFLCKGPPHLYVKGISLKFLTTDIAWKDLKQAFTAKETLSLNEIKDAYAECGPDYPQLVYAEGADYFLEQTEAPLPLLKLHERTGAFADLWMIYKPSKTDHEIKVPFHSGLTAIPDANGKNAGKRKADDEKQWELDLLQTDFIRKNVGTTHYYCPIDCVAKSLTFLLEIGWKIEDHQGRSIHRQTNMDLHVDLEQQFLHIKGKIHYDSHEVNLNDVIGAFNRKERFVQLGNGTVGLLPDKLQIPGLKSAIEEGEIVQEGIRVHRNRLGALTDLFEATEGCSYDKNLLELKDRLLSFQGITESLPSENFKGTLRAYQQEGVNWLTFLYDHHLHGLLADDMGLGKTVQVLAFLKFPITQPILIILPTSLLFNWKQEINRFLPETPLLIHHGPLRTKTSSALNHPHIILTSYTTLRIDLPLFKEISYECIILDEAQTIKNSQSQIAKSLYQLQGRFRLSLTGTPIENHLGEMWSHFRFLMPDLFGDEQTFMADMEAASLDPRYLQKIRKKIRPFILRRKKEDVAKDLPERIEQTVWVEMASEQQRIYDDFLTGFRGNLFKKIQVDGIASHRMEVLEAILRLRQICCHPLLALPGNEDAAMAPSSKLDALMQDLETVVEEGSKVLVYSQFTTMLQKIASEIKARQWEFVYLDGTTTNREKIVNKFQEDPSIPIFLISLKAGGIGLNLTAADYVFLFDPWWNEAAENQAIDRAHRIGRKKTVIAKRYIAVETIEEKIMKLKAMKSSLAKSLIHDDFSSATFSFEELQFLIE